ncbi:hypothetical protein [Massilia orientalis]|uniref:Uncharacterized protein n=1 Tax=Massilia orientalis TaxID=3050128 RepID=A0ACC7MLK3_9BURK|nr:hypothetical protein [Massilia sp. YIM B02787]
MNTPKRSTASWQAADKSHFVHPFTDTASLHKDGAQFIVRDHGVWLRDSEDNVLLDGMADRW